MCNTDTVSFIAWSPNTPSISDPEIIARLVERWRVLGYRLTQGLAWPFDAPDNLITDGDAIHQRIVDVCDLSKRRRTLNLWHAPLEFSFRITRQSLTSGATWTLFAEIDTLMGPNNDFGESNAASLIHVIQSTLEVLPTLYGCLFSTQMPPSDEQVLGFIVNTVYPVNYFGEEYVRRVGAEKLRSSPAWSVREVRRGMLIVPGLRAMYGGDLAALRALQLQVFGNQDIGLVELT